MIFEQRIPGDGSFPLWSSKTSEIVETKPYAKLRGLSGLYPMYAKALRSVSLSSVSKSFPFLRIASVNRALSFFFFSRREKAC